MALPGRRAQGLKHINLGTNPGSWAYFSCCPNLRAPRSGEPVTLPITISRIAVSGGDSKTPRVSRSLGPLLPCSSCVRLLHTLG